MGRISFPALAFVVAGSIAVCDAPNTVGPTQVTPDAPAMARAHTQGGTLDKQRTVSGWINGSDEYGDVCGGGAGMVITSTGHGVVTHLGATLMVSTMCVNMSDYSVIGEAPFYFQAANGDRVGGILTNVVYTDYGFDLYTAVTWGTGRFEGATGELVFPTESTGTGVWTSGVEGWLTY